MDVGVDKELSGDTVAREDLGILNCCRIGEGLGLSLFDIICNKVNGLS